MRNGTNLLILFIITINGCAGILDPKEPQHGQNLITNSTFELFGLPSLAGWTSTDNSVVLFSKDIPPGGSGWSIILHIRQGPAPLGLYNSIYTPITTGSGTHRCRLTFFGKMKGEGGGNVFLYYHRPGTENAVLIDFISVVDTGWARYSRTDTVTTIPQDTLFVMITGGSCECSGTSYINTCKFEELD